VLYELMHLLYALDKLDIIISDMRWLERCMLPSSLASACARTCGASRITLPINQWNNIALAVSMVVAKEKIPINIGRIILCKVATSSLEKAPGTILKRRRTLAVEKIDKLFMCLHSACMHLI